MNYQKIFPRVQVGYITQLVEPVNINSPLEFIKEGFRKDENLTAQPVEGENGGVIGILEREDFTGKHGVIDNLIHNNIKHYCKTDTVILNAREDAERALQEVLKVKGGFVKNCMVFYNGKYYGIVDTIQLIQHIQDLKKTALLTAQTIQTYMTGPKEIETSFFKSKVEISMAHELGGDFHHIEKFSEDNCLLSFFDVSGKNVSAALITGLISGYFSTISQTKLCTGDGHEKIIENLHAIIQNKTPDGIFIACIFIFCDGKNKKIKIYNHGYSTIYLIKKDGNKRKIQLHDPDFPPLGFPSLNLDSGKALALSIEPNLLIFGSSDGLTDAHDPYGVPFGDDQVMKVLSAALSKGNTQVVDEMLKNVESFISDSPRTDDITLFQIEFK